MRKILIFILLLIAVVFTKAEFSSDSSDSDIEVVGNIQEHACFPTHKLCLDACAKRPEVAADYRCDDEPLCCGPY